MYKIIGIRYIVVLIILLYVFDTCVAQEKNPTFNFLSLPSNTQSMTVGGYTASIVANDPLLVMDNPSLFGTEHNKQLSVSGMYYLGGSMYGSLFYSNKWGERRAWGVGARYINYGKLQRRDTYGGDLGVYYPSDVLVQGSFSYELSEYIRGGASFKGIYSSIDNYKAFGLGVDVGLNYYSEYRDTSIGICIVNVGALVKPYSSTREYLPWDVRIGISQKLAHAPFSLHLTIYDLHREREPLREKGKPVSEILRHCILGVQFIPDRHFYIGVGYNPKIAQDMKNISGGNLGGITAGIGFQSQRYRVGVSAMSFDKSRYSIMANFNWDFNFGQL